jgi:predicted nucleic-acid-binding protein
MIAVDTNILARFYCDDPDDAEAKRQRPRARRVMIESSAVFVPLTVVLEFEWVMRGFYEVNPETFCQTIDHLLGMAHVTVERWEAVKDVASSTGAAWTSPMLYTGYAAPLAVNS